jgi:hypothetical protein
VHGDKQVCTARAGPGRTHPTVLAHTFCRV